MSHKSKTPPQVQRGSRNMKHFNVFPKTLYRLQNSKKINLRAWTPEIAEALKSYDFITHPDGLIHPISGDFFSKPNGMSLRPIGVSLMNIAKSYDFKWVYVLKEGISIPNNLVLVHEYNDHYSLQTTEPCSITDFNDRLNEFIKDQPALSSDEFKKLLIEYSNNKMGKN